MVYLDLQLFHKKEIHKIVEKKLIHFIMIELVINLVKLYHH